MGTLEGVPGRGFRSLLLLVNWELWLERIARTFKRAERPVHILLLKIKEEARNWGFAGAKHLSALLEGAYVLVRFCVFFDFLFSRTCFVFSPVNSPPGFFTCNFLLY